VGFASRTLSRSSDFQNDFTRGAAPPVAEGDQIAR